LNTNFLSTSSFVDGTVNVGGAITHQVECNMFFKRHVERVRMDVYNLEKIEVILGMPWLAAYNPEIDWEKEEVRMTHCPPICEKKKQKEKRKEVKKAEKDEFLTNKGITNFIWPYLHQFFDNSHSLNDYGKPLKRPFDQYQSRLKAISIGRDIRQINW